MSFITEANTRSQQRVLNDDIRMRSNIDTYSQSTPLTLAQTRPIMTDLHRVIEHSLIIHNEPAVTLSVGDRIQLTVLLHYLYDNAQARDVTSRAIWASSNAAKATVSNGLVIAVAAGTTNITVTLDDLVSNTIVITVV